MNDGDITVGGRWKILNKTYDGELIFNKENGNCILSIYYEDDREFLAWMNKPDEFDIITGKLNQQVKCSLIKCIIVKRHSEFGKRHHIVICAESIIFGINNKKDVLFNEMHFKICNIIKWSGLSGFIISDDDKDCRINLKYAFKPKITQHIDANTIIDFEPVFGKFNYDTQIEKIDISQSIEIRIKKNKKTSIKEFIDDLEKVLSLITLSTGVKINVNKIYGMNYKKYNLINGKKDFVKFEIITSLLDNFIHSNPDKIENSMNYLFRLKEIQENGGLERWFNTYEDNEKVYELYNLAINNRIPKEIKFCNLMQSLELIHTNKYKSVKKFYKHIEEKFKDNYELINLIKNNPDQKEKFILLKNRLIDLFTEKFYLLNDSNIKNNIDELSSIFADSRNYYTHYMGSKKKKSLTGKNLDFANYFLEYLITSNILLNLGFSIEKINEKKNIQVGNIRGRKMIDYILKCNY